MSDNRISLDIVTPEKNVFSADVYYFHIPTTAGSIGVYPRHAAVVTGLDVGELAIDDGNGNREVLFIGGGFLEVGGNKAVVLAKSAERSEEIDVERAEKAKARAEQRLAEHSEDLDVARAELALKRALQRIKIASKN